MNKTLGLFFHQDFLLAAVRPFEGRFEPLHSRGGFPLYFMEARDGIRFGNFKSDFEDSKPNTLGNFFDLLDAKELFARHGLRNGMELLTPVLRAVREKYFEVLDHQSEQPLDRETPIPTRLCFDAALPPQATEAISSFLENSKFQFDRAPAKNLPEQLSVYLRQTGVLATGKTHGVLEALGTDLVMSLVEIDYQGNVKRLGTEIKPNYALDPRVGVLAQYAVDMVNEEWHVLRPDQREQEIGRMIPLARKWNQDLKNTALPFIQQKVEMQGAHSTVTFSKSEIDRRTLIQSKQIAGFFEALRDSKEVRVEKVVLLGDPLALNAAVLEGFQIFGQKNLVPLRDENAVDVLQGMLQPEIEAKPVQSQNAWAAVPRLYTNTLQPGDRVRLHWEPGREVLAVFEGFDSFLVEKALNAKIVAGDRFVANRFVLGEGVEMRNVIRTLEGRKLGDYRSGALSDLRIRKV